MPQSILHCIETHAREKPHATAITAIDSQGGQSEITFRDLLDRAACISSLFDEHETHATDRVMLAIPDPIAFACSLLACWQRGIVAVPCSPLGSSSVLVHRE